MTDPITVWNVQCGAFDVIFDERTEAAIALMDLLIEQGGSSGCPYVQTYQMDRAEYEALEEAE